MTPHRLYVGTIGEGLFRSLDGGRTFRRACDGTFVECDVRALVVHPRQPSVLYMGSELGLFRSDDGADHWTRLDGPLAGSQVWSVHVPPLRPDDDPRRDLPVGPVPLRRRRPNLGRGGGDNRDGLPAHPAHPRNLRCRRSG